MNMPLTWDEAKRQANLAKHGLDFADAGCVVESNIRLDIVVARGGEERTQPFAYVYGRLAVLLVVHVEREDAARIISFRSTSEKETEVYHDWLAQDDA